MIMTKYERQEALNKLLLDLEHQHANGSKKDFDFLNQDLFKELIAWKSVLTATEFIEFLHKLSTSKISLPHMADLMRLLSEENLEGDIKNLYLNIIKFFKRERIEFIRGAAFRAPHVLPPHVTPIARFLEKIYMLICIGQFAFNDEELDLIISVAAHHKYAYKRFIALKDKAPNLSEKKKIVTKLKYGLLQHNNDTIRSIFLDCVKMHKNIGLTSKEKKMIIYQNIMMMLNLAGCVKMTNQAGILLEKQLKNCQINTMNDLMEIMIQYLPKYTIKIPVLIEYFVDDISTDLLLKLPTIFASLSEKMYYHFGNFYTALKMIEIKKIKVPQNLLTAWMQFCFKTKFPAAAELIAQLRDKPLTISEIEKMTYKK